MTGDWQVSARRASRCDEMVTIDYLYVANWSLWADIKILLRTIPCVVGQARPVIDGGGARAARSGARRA